MRFPQRPPPFDLVSASKIAPKAIAHFSPVLPDGRYLHWDDLRNRPPPDGLNREERWLLQRFARVANATYIPSFLGADDKPFWFCRLSEIDQATHELDRRDATREMLEALGDDGARYAYRIDQLIEESINSSVLEGAKLTTRAQAKAMIRDGLAPRDTSERMVVNNFYAMKRLLEGNKKPLTVDDLLEIHAILGQDALDAPDAAGRLRTAGERVRVEDQVTHEVWFEPPPAEELPTRLAAMLAFANEDNPSPFLHPLLRAIVLHFWLAYLHPFVDGNGRMARALFYWQMLRSGYDFAQYLSISGPIDRSRRAYYLAFAHTETDDGDLTYFLLHQLQVLRTATAELLSHLRERSTRMRQLSSVVKGSESLNHRQRAALLYSVRNPHQGITVKGHAQSHGIAYLTARKDLQQLEKLLLLRRVRAGTADRYFPTENFINLERSG